MNAADALRVTARRRPDHPAAISDGGARVCTYAELLARADEVTDAITATGIRTGDRVALFLTNDPDHVAIWFGVLQAGAVAVDMNIVLGDEEWSYILSDCGPALVIAAPAFAERARRVCGGLGIRVLETTGIADAAGGSPAPTPRADLPPDALAVIAYTSGTTGLPKGVMHSHARIAMQLDLLQQVTAIQADDVVPTFLPLFPLHANLSQAALCVAVGATLLMFDKFSVEALRELAAEHPISFGTMVPAIVTALLAAPPERRPRFAGGSRFQVGGAPLPPATRAAFETAFDTVLLQGFGCTEVMGAIAMERIDARAPWGSCGSLWPGIAEGGLVRVVDDDDRDVAPGEVGEFLVHRSRALLGYWGSAQQTAGAFADGQWFRTGDVGRIDADDFVYLLDRKKDMIIRGGFNIYSAEIERVLVEHDAVAEAHVIAAPHPELGEVPIAYVVLAPGAEDDATTRAALVTSVRDRLGPLKAVEAIHVVGAADLPRNAMGKVLKRELRAAAVLPLATAGNTP